jgi:eukaryotic-like serine/threonine-protein kinase
MHRTGHDRHAPAARRPLGRVVALSIALSLGSVALATAAPASAPGKKQSAVEQWPTFRHNPEHDGFNATEKGISPKNVAQLEVLWEAPGLGSPAVVDGVVYVGGPQGTTHAYNAKTGKELWVVDGSASTAPTVSNGVVYLHGAKKVLALKAKDGSEIWSQPLDGIDVGTNKVGNVIFTGGGVGANAYDAKTGDVLWSTNLGNASIGAPAVSKGVAYVTSTADGATSSEAFALKAKDGSIIWRTSVPGMVVSSTAVQGGLVYLGTSVGDVMALNVKDGSVKWDMKDPNRKFVPTSGALAYGNIYIGAFDGSEYAFNAKTGELVWSTPAGGMILSSAGVANGVVYFGGYDGNVYALAAKTGKKLFEFPTGDIVSSSPAIVDGVVYVGSNEVAKNGVLHAFALPKQK